MKDDNLIHCPKCGRALAAQAAGYQVMRPDGREVMGLFLGIKCEKIACGGVRRPEQPVTLPAAAAAPVG